MISALSTHAPTFSVIMPVYNVEDFVTEAVASVLDQTCSDFELLIIDDCSPDASVALCQAFNDPRLRIVRHRQNRGLAGARNTGIREARGRFLAFLDSDDRWHPDKLMQHAAHLEANPRVGLSFSRSAFIDADGQPTRCYQMPQLTQIDAGLLFCRNPVGNGSAPVMRREALDAIAFEAPFAGIMERCYFDPSLRRSEDIECWVRLALTTDWQLEGLPAPLTEYRLNAGGLSSSLYQQLASWETVAAKTAGYAPEFMAEWGPIARAYQLRYLSRQAIRLGDGKAAVNLLHSALACHWRILLAEPSRTLQTATAAYLMRWIPGAYRRLEGLALGVIGQRQRRRIHAEMAKR
ncbi:glycosyltransferase family 2 protein [Onishia taeanensis]